VAQKNYTGTKNRSKQQRTTTTPFYLSKVLLETFPFFVCLKITPAAALERTCGVQSRRFNQHNNPRFQREQLEGQAQPASPSHYTGQGKDVYVHNMP
jgi:hypothetical protein